MFSFAIGAFISSGLLLLPADLSDAGHSAATSAQTIPVVAPAPFLPPWNQAMQAIVAELAKPPAFPSQRHPRPRPSPIRDFG